MQEVRGCATPDPALLAWLDRLSARHCPVVAMERAGVYGRPVSHALAGAVEGLLGHAHERRRRTGRQPDQADAGWIAALLARGLIRPSVVPPPAIHARRDLTRTRVALAQTRSQAKHRVVAGLEDTHIKRSSVVADLPGVSGRRRLAALIAGEGDPHVLAALATGGLRRTLAPLGGR